MIEYLKKSDNIAKKLGYKFVNNQLFILAITHGSYDKTDNNQRLEFLGDAILNLVIAEYLYDKAKDADEGDLTRIRSNLVKQETLADIARKYSVQETIILGIGELKTGGFNKDSILSDTLEAIIGAIYLDSDFLTIKKLILDWYSTTGYLQNISDTIKDPKTILQELLHSKGLPLPIYNIVKVTGKPHRQKFIVSCTVNTIQKMIHGNGSSRQKAEQDAAIKVLGLLL